MLEVSRVVVAGGSGPCAFNEDRPWVINVHSSLAEAGGKALETELEAAIEQAGLGGTVVLDWFGEGAPERLEIVLGRDLPVPLARAVVGASRAHATVPLVVSVAEEQSTTCSRSQAYAGSLLPTDHPPTTTDALDQLLQTTLNDAAFWALIPPSGR